MTSHEIGCCLFKTPPDAREASRTDLHCRLRAKAQRTYAPLATQIRRDLLSLVRSEEAPAVAIALEAWISESVT